MGQALRKAIIRLDFFSAPATLRAQEQGKTSSVCLGVFSFMLFCLFGVILISKLVSLFIKDSSQIDYSSKSAVDIGQRKIQNFMLGLSIQKDNQMIPAIQLQQYFTVDAAYTQSTSQKEYNTIGIKIQPCHPQLWNLLGEHYLSTYAQFNLDSYLCFNKAINKISVNNDNVPGLSLNLSFCKSNQNNCKSEDDVLKFYNQIVDKFGFITINVNFLTPYAQLSDKEPLKYRVQNKKFMASKNQSRYAYIMGNRFNISIDSSVFSFSEDPSDKNGFNFGQIFYFNSKESFKSNNVIFGLDFFISKNIVLYSQSFKKIDEILSDVGGLMGILGFFLIFLLRTYNQYRYQLLVAQNSFNFNTDGYKIKQDDFNIFLYFKFRIFFWIFLLFNKQLNDKKCKQISKTLHEARKLLQVSHFFRRIQVLQRYIWNTRDRNLLYVSALRQSEPLKKVQNKRLTLSYYRKIINMQEAATVEDALNQTSQSFRYLEQIKSQLDKNSITIQQKQQNPMLLYRAQSGRQIAQKKQQNNQNTQQTQRRLKQNLMKYLKLQNQPQMCLKISHYTLIFQQANSFKFQEDDQEQYLQIQKQITQSFIRLDHKDRKQLMMKIPMKIIFRLLKCAMSLQQQNKQKNQVQLKQIKRQNQGSQQNLQNKVSKNVEP